MCSGPRPSSRASPSLRASPPPSNKPVDTTLLVDRLAQLIRAEKLDLSVLLENRPPVHRPAHLRLAAAPITPVPTPTKPPVNHSNTARPSCPPSSPPINTDSKPVPISSSASVVNSPSLAQDLLPIAPPVPRRMAARGSHWSFLEKARFEAALQRYGPFAWDRILEAVGTRTEKQVKAYAARYRRRKRLAARMHALAVQPQQQQPFVQAIMPEQRPPYSKQCPAPPLRPKNEAAVAAPELKDVKQEPSTLTNWFAQEMSGTFADDNSPVDDGQFFSGGLFSHALLGSTGEETDPLSDVPSEVDLLVDRAIEGQSFVEDDEGKQLLHEIDDGPEYSSEFLNTWFKS